ncbi:hypothetical protein [Streptomyces sp. NBC_00273]|uniref:hypothetical protein n=1 Tax=Streptomyces sp. NBC_00273 TaxID=2903644 RepID=UPI002E281EF0|nr:hypothetical protein [Streptomyces sp. NBC_00273]
MGWDRGIAVAAAVVLVAAGAAGCTGTSAGKTAGTTPAAEATRPSAPPAPPLVIAQAEAEKVFSRFEWERRTPAGWKPADGMANVATGPLLAEWKANAAIRALRNWPGTSTTSLVKPSFVIPAERDQPSHPRFFVALSKANGWEDGPATAVHYFVQEAPGGEWKAAVETWMATAAPASPESESVARFAATTVQLRKTPVAAAGRDAAGAAVLSPTADADRTVCGRFADYTSFTTPDKPENEHFAPGPLTDEMIGKLAEMPKAPELNGLARYSFEHEVTGPRLPVLKLDNGASLVACPLLRTEEVRGKSATVSFTFDEDSERGALLNTKGKKWRSSDAKLSLTALIEVPPAGDSGPAQMAACNCLEPQLLEISGKRAD